MDSLINNSYAGNLESRFDRPREGESPTFMIVTNKKKITHRMDEITKYAKIGHMLVWFKENKIKTTG